MGPKIASKEIQLTIQGQTISSNFGTVDAAQYNMEQLLHAGLRNALFQSPETIQPGYGVVNAEVLLSNPNAGWRVALVGKNLTNRSYATNLITGAGYVTRTVARDERRYVGVTARTRCPSVVNS